MPIYSGIVEGDLSGGGTAAASPYVIAMDNLRISGLQHFVNVSRIISHLGTFVRLVIY